MHMSLVAVLAVSSVLHLALAFMDALTFDCLWRLCSGVLARRGRRDVPVIHARRAL